MRLLVVLLVVCAAALVQAQGACKTTKLGKEYQGDLAKTKSGKTCQRWNKQAPHKHTRNKNSLFPGKSVDGAENYCRNPDNEPNGPWCYTTAANKRWEYCDVPFCKVGAYSKVTGAPSRVANDAPSTVHCPKGQRVLRCRCVRSENRCDGAAVTAHNTCTAYNHHWAKKAIRAEAICITIKDLKVTNNIEPKSGIAKNPTVHCAKGGTVLSCTAHNPWGHENNDWGATRHETKCTTHNCPRCKVSVVCAH